MSRSLALLLVLVAGTLVVDARHPALGATHDAWASGARFVAVDGDDANDDEDKPHVRAKDAGSIDGEVVNVDYRTNRMSVRSGGQTYEVTILPSTDFRGHSNSFRGITDVKRGAHVNVMLSQRASQLTAQIIHLH